MVSQISSVTFWQFEIFWLARLAVITFGRIRGRDEVWLMQGCGFRVAGWSALPIVNSFMARRGCVYLLANLGSFSRL
jgi:hypothetical protein